MYYRYEFSRDNHNNIFTTTDITPYCPEMVHNCLEFIYVRDGLLRLSIEGKDHFVGAGQLAAIASFTPHLSGIVENGEMYLAMIPRDFVRRYDQKLNSFTFAKPVVNDSDGYIFSVMLMLFSTNGTFDGFNIKPAEPFTNSPELLHDAKCRVCEILCATAISACGLVARKTGTRDIYGAVSYIDSHFREKLTVSEIAKALFMNQQTLSTEFRNLIGISITKYISRVRVCEVANLITQEPELTLSDAADRAGYQSMRSMLRDFSEEFGMTPTEFRNKESGVDIFHEPYQKI